MSTAVLVLVGILSDDDSSSGIKLLTRANRKQSILRTIRPKRLWNRCLGRSEAGDPPDWPVKQPYCSASMSRDKDLNQDRARGLK